MDVITVLVPLAALLVLGLIGAAVFLMVQKRSIERAAVERADALIAENTEGSTPRGSVSQINEHALRDETSKAA